MSHFTKIKTQMVEKEHLTRALEDLGFKWEAGDVDIRGFAGQRTHVDIKISSGSHADKVGFKKSGNAYEIVADWWGTRSAARDKFNQQITQKYAYHAARAKLEAQGFTLVSEETLQDGQVHLMLRRVN